MEVTDSYAVRTDRRGRLHLRRAAYEYYEVTEYANGTILLVPCLMISPETLADMYRAAENYKNGTLPEPINHLSKI